MDGRLSALDLLTAGEARAIAPPARRGPGGRARALRSLLRSEGPDLLCTYNWGSFDAVLAARSLGFRRHIHHEDGFNIDEATRQKRRRILARRLLLPRAHRVIVPSERLRSIALETWRLPADKVTLIRRVTLDLTGLPPTPAYVDAFLADDASDAYDQVVDRLLNTSRYGEHMARFWLDAARYGDTHGLHLDKPSSGFWPSRIWNSRTRRTSRPPLTACCRCRTRLSYWNSVNPHHYSPRSLPS